MKIFIQELKKITLIIFFLTIGLLFTIYFMEAIYGTAGIEFLGDLWVVWFAISYIFYFLYLIIKTYISENSRLKERKKLKTFWIWLLLIIAIVIVAAPFFIGRIPY